MFFNISKKMINFIRRADFFKKVKCLFSGDAKNITKVFNNNTFFIYNNPICNNIFIFIIGIGNKIIQKVYNNRLKYLFKYMQ